MAEMKKKMNPVVHFEMPAQDTKRIAQFYAEVFGWQTQFLGEAMGNYVLATTTESDGKGPKKPGAINGGFYPKTPDLPNCPSVVIAVDNLQQSMKKIAESGGQIIGEPIEIPGIGQFVSFTDTEGNRVGMLEPIPPQ